METRHHYLIWAVVKLQFKAYGHNGFSVCLLNKYRDPSILKIFSSHVPALQNFPLLPTQVATYRATSLMF